MGGGPMGGGPMGGGPMGGGQMGGGQMGGGQVGGGQVGGGQMGGGQMGLGMSGCGPHMGAASGQHVGTSCGQPSGCYPGALGASGGVEQHDASRDAPNRDDAGGDAAAPDSPDAGGGGEKHRSSKARAADEEAFGKFKEAVVAFGKELLREPYERKLITKDVYKMILKKTAEKVRQSLGGNAPLSTPGSAFRLIPSGALDEAPPPRSQVLSGFKKEGLPPPPGSEIAGSQRAKIQKLIQDYKDIYSKS